MKQTDLRKIWFAFGLTAFAGISAFANDQGAGAKAAPENPYGTGLYAYSLTDNNEVGGLFAFSLDGKNTNVWTTPFTDSYLFNGWLYDGRICGINMLTNDSGPELLRYNEYDFETGAVVATKTLDATNLMNYFKFCVYLPEKNQIFGVGVDDRNFSCVKYMNMDNFLETEQPEVVVVKEINYTQYILSICYNPVDKNVYAIDEENNMVRINQETGDYEKLLTIPGNRLATGRPQGLTYLPNKDEFLLAGMWSSDLSAHLYRIDIKENKVIEVGSIENNPYITFFANTQGTDGTVPVRPTYVSATFPNGQLNGQVTFTMPQTLADGSAAPQNMVWTLLVDGEAAATGTGAAGETVSADVTMTQGNHSLEMLASNNGHEGPSAKTDIYVGNDTPKAPSNVVLQEGKVTWDAVTEGVNGGYIDSENLTYEVYINDEYIGETAETEITFTVAEGDSFSRHIAEVRAISNDLESESGVSEPVLYGKPMQLDVHFDCATSDDAEFFSSVYEGEYYPAWGFNNWQSAFATSKGYYGGEAWLVTPPINFSDEDALYSLVFDLKEESEWDQSPEFATYLVSPEEITKPVQTICGKYDLPADFSWGTVEKMFKVPAAGAYCIAFVSRQNGGGNTVMMKNLDIKRSTMAGNAPNVPDEFTATAAEHGELKAIVSFNMPAKDVSGNDIPSDAVITATIKCGEATASVSGAPASAQSVEIETVRGNNEITASFAIGESEGLSCSTTVFTGKDVPAAPLNAVAIVDADNKTVTFKWDAPATGANGYYFDTEGIRYILKNKAGWSWTELATVEDSTTEATVTLPDYDYLNLLNIMLVAANEFGEGGSVTVPVMVGKPYELPMDEQFKDVSYYTYGPVYLDTPSSEYSSALLYFMPPYQLNDAFSDKIEHTSIAVFPGVQGESRSRVVLPKFSTLNDNAENQTVKFSFEMYAGDIMAEDITFYVTSYDIEEPVALTKVEPAGGWSTVEFELPKEFMNKNWVNLYVDSRYQKDGTYTVIYTYNIDFSDATSVEGINNQEGVIYAADRYVYFKNLENEEYSIFTLDGKLVKGGKIDSANLAVGLNSGIYVAKAGTKTVKVVLK